MSAIVWPLSRDPWKDLTNSHTVANTVWGTNSDLHLLPGLKPSKTARHGDRAVSANSSWM